jgi:hypothetical protein
MADNEDIGPGKAQAYVTDFVLVGFRPIDSTRQGNDSIGASVQDAVGLTLLLTNRRLTVSNDGGVVVVVVFVVVVDMDLEHYFDWLTDDNMKESRLEQARSCLGVKSDVVVPAAARPGVWEAEIDWVMAKLVAGDRELVQTAVSMLDIDANDDPCPRRKPHMPAMTKDPVQHCGNCLAIPSPSRTQTSL